MCPALVVGNSGLMKRHNWTRRWMSTQCTVQYLCMLLSHINRFTVVSPTSVKWSLIALFRSFLNFLHTSSLGEYRQHLCIALWLSLEMYTTCLKMYRAKETNRLRWHVTERNCFIIKKFSVPHNTRNAGYKLCWIPRVQIFLEIRHENMWLLFRHPPERRPPGLRNRAYTL